MQSGGPDEATRTGGAADDPADTLDMLAESVASARARAVTIDGLADLSDDEISDVDRDTLPPPASPTPRGFSAVRPVVPTHDTTAPPGDGPVIVHTAPPPPAPLTAEEAKERLGRYQLVREIDRGGMGAVLEAHDPDLGRTVAVKVVLPAKANRVATVDRFMAEARLTSQLQHPNIVPVHDFGVDAEGRVFYAMKKVEGTSLDKIIRGLRKGFAEVEARWTRARLLRAFVQICHGMAYAHQREVIHRDLKPANIMIGAFGEVLVMDWGLGRLITSLEEPTDSVTSFSGVDLGSTADGIVKGTPGYMSPEQVDGRLSDLRPSSDVFCLGLILYELLTFKPAFEGRRTITLLIATTRGVKRSPRERAPGRAIPAEIDAICMKALSLAAADRYPTAAELGEAVEAFLEGSKRRELAGKEVDAGAALWIDHRFLDEEIADLTEEERGLATSVPAWAPLAEKAQLLGLRSRLEDLRTERAKAFGRVIGAGERALSHDPHNPEARELLAWAYWHRFLKAEERGDAAEQAYYEDRCVAYDDGALTALLAGRGTITLATDPPGAEVWCERFERQGLVWKTTERVSLGATPLARAPLDMGSYRLTLEAEGFDEVVYPVLIERQDDWDAGRPVRLLRPGELRDGFRYVPAGPFVSGGDPTAISPRPRARVDVDAFAIAELPVSTGEYCDFLNAVQARDPAEARARAPRHAERMDGPANLYYAVPEPGGRWEVPEIDAEGDRWTREMPQFSVSWDDALAFAAWASERDGVRYSLPTEDQWEKAARGVDGRFFPWGDDFDASLCKIASSRPGRPQPEDRGTFLADRSVYGVRDVVGTIREWCCEPDFDGDAGRRPVRGGSWMSAPRQAHPATRFGLAPEVVVTYLGFRLTQVLD